MLKGSLCLTPETHSVPHDVTTRGLDAGAKDEVRVPKVWLWDGYNVRRGVDLHHKFGSDVSSVIELRREVVSPPTQPPDSPRVSLGRRSLRRLSSVEGTFGRPLRW
jgi:hypothetical protein